MLEYHHVMLKYQHLHVMLKYLHIMKNIYIAQLRRSVFIDNMSSLYLNVELKATTSDFLISISCTSIWINSASNEYMYIHSLQQLGTISTNGNSKLLKDLIFKTSGMQSIRNSSKFLYIIIRELVYANRMVLYKMFL